VRSEVPLGPRREECFPSRHPEETMGRIGRATPGQAMKIAFWGNFGTGNLGNECTLHAALAAAHRHAAGADTLAVCSNPADTVASHGVEAVSIAPARSTARSSPRRSTRILGHLAAELRDWVRVAGTMRTADALVMTGTGMLTDKHEPFLGMPYQMLKWAAAAALWRRKVLFVSVGVEELVNPFKVRLMGWALRLARYRSFRDVISRERASGLVRASPPDPIFPDLAFSLPRASATGDGNPPPGTTAVAVGLYGVETDAMTAYVDAMGTFVLRLLDRGHRIRLVIGDREYDRRARERLGLWLQERGVGDRVLAEPITSLQELVGELGRTDFVVATRFHNLVLGLLQGKPVLSISHMDKNDQLMAAMGLSAYCLPLNDLEPQRLLESFDRMERSAEELRGRIQERVETWRERLEDQYATVFGDVADRRPRGNAA
jgi:polysaccharide pyruvyl transferase WcaK-like protein